ncbi:P-II family nitrogen regulator [Lutibacter sp. HS1-25]|uniref:P-II family nitrogen regulator n=1 Tax=Lutibacter sp. HS1-25 TaxID=2485000 RepID=UPI001011AE7A|nr:P-II family nitrogen regulator [Lutibacter sp. HS1-25]RXP54816.1 P-II family nitrogen regulator [Lutibacter sp. HS1-25]|tara:strand:+ start:2346 stop:2666 length:321 start_codon:yes stop_codon:yes gene_type:complete
MKEIKAFIRPEKLNTVAKYLKKEHFCCFTVFKGEGVGDYTDPDTEYPSLDFPFLHNKVVKIELVCNKEEVPKIIKTIKTHAQTGHSGDGLIYVSNVESKTRIRETI